MVGHWSISTGWLESDSRLVMRHVDKPNFFSTHALCVPAGFHNSRDLRGKPRASLNTLYCSNTDDSKKYTILKPRWRNSKIFCHRHKSFMCQRENRIRNNYASAQW